MSRSKRRSVTYRLEWRGIVCRVKHSIAYFAYTDMIEVRVARPVGAILPITETGYRAEFRTSAEIAAAGGVVALVTTMIEAEAATPRWRKAEIAHAQLELFPQQ